MSLSKFPARLRRARQAKRFSQLALAERLGVSVQAVSQWETGASYPAIQRLSALSKVLEVDWDWLEGAGEDNLSPRFQIKSDDTPISLPIARLLDRYQIAAWAKHYSDDLVEPDLLGDEMHSINIQSKTTNLSPTYPPVGVIFALEIERESMNPDFQVGEHVIIDCGLTPLPGDFVAACIEGDPRATFRRYRAKGKNQYDEEIVELMPLNLDYPTVTISKFDKPGRILGVMTEHRRYRRRR